MNTLNWFQCQRVALSLSKTKIISHAKELTLLAIPYPTTVTTYPYKNIIGNNSDINAYKNKSLHKHNKQ